MSRFDVTRDEERLTLSLAKEDSVIPGGCSFLVAFAFFTLLWLVALVIDTPTSGERGPEGLSQFYGPSSRLFGLLWILGFFGMLFLVPLYVYTLTHPGLTFSFSRASGLFLRNRTVVSPLRRIEFLLLCRLIDHSGALLHRLIVVYLDGHELALHESYDRDEIESLAEQISGFIDVPVIHRRKRHQGFPFPPSESEENE